MNIAENTPTRLTLHDAGKMNAAVAWGIAIAGGIGTIVSIIAVIVAVDNPAAGAAASPSPGNYAMLIVSILLLAAGLCSLSIVSETTCTFDKDQGRFLWRHKQVFRGASEKRYPIASIKSIEVTQKKIGSSQASQPKTIFYWMVVTKSGVRFEEPGAGAATRYDADVKANRIRDFLGKSLVPSAQDTVGNERGIGDRTVFGILAQLTDPSKRSNEP